MGKPFFSRQAGRGVCLWIAENAPAIEFPSFHTWKQGVSSREPKAGSEKGSFPVPKGDIVTTGEQAERAAERIGYPVEVKPVAGHKGIGVTADVRDVQELKFAFARAVQSIGPDQPKQRSTIAELIDRENRKPARQDTPTSPLSKIQSDEAMEMYLHEQGLSTNSVIEANRTVYLRKVANLSAGGVSIDATRTAHPDNIILAQDIASHFRLTCLGIDAIAETLSKSWKDN